MFVSYQIVLKNQTDGAKIQKCFKMSNDFGCNWFCQLTSVIPCFKQTTHCLKNIHPRRTRKYWKLL